MRIIFIILFSLCFLQSEAQYPKGQPYPYSTGYSRQGYLRVDSGLIYTDRDTNWTPRFNGTSVYWQKQIWIWDSVWMQRTFSFSDVTNAIAANDVNNIHNQYAAKQNASSWYVKSRLDTFGIGVNPVYPFQIGVSTGGVSFDGQTFGLHALNFTNAFVGDGAGVYNGAPVPGNFNYGFGLSALPQGTGNDKIAIGFFSVTNVNGSNVIGIGSNTLNQTDGSNLIGVGVSAGKNTYTQRSVLIGTNTSIGTVAAIDTIPVSNIRLWSKKIGGLTSFFAAAGLTTGNSSAFQLSFTGTPPSLSGGPLSNPFNVKAGVLSTDTLGILEGDIVDIGTGEIIVTAYTQTENSIAIGDSVNAEKSNMVALGNANVTQLKSGAGLKINTALIPTSGQVMLYDTTHNEYRPASLGTILSVTATRDFTSIAAGATQVVTVTVTGAELNDVVSLGLPNTAMTTGIIFGTPWVSAANTVSIQAYNPTGDAIDLASATFKIHVFK